MRFLDSSVFLHAFLKPRRPLTKEELEVKEKAKSIVRSVERGEEVLTTVVHLSEVANIIESRLGVEASVKVMVKLLSMSNVVVDDVTRRDYEKAVALAVKHRVGVNDALAYVRMREHGISEVYTFDKHFKSLPGVKVVQAPKKQC